MSFKEAVRLVLAIIALVTLLPAVAFFLYQIYFGNPQPTDIVTLTELAVLPWWLPLASVPILLAAFLLIAEWADALEFL
ncbi:hypothetical protein [Halovenus sp. HT40]|uniref:hypothetical protein n=1 Tax=Halovenus sp. HT40 TaxID=3126691 RepID=UPI00300F505F